MAKSPKARRSADARSDGAGFCDWLAAQAGVEAIAFDGDFYARACQSYLAFLGGDWPDASGALALVPHGEARRELLGRLRSHLGPGKALFGFAPLTYRQWALAQLPAREHRFVSDDEALLSLAMRIRDHGGVRYNQNHWQFATALIDLFGRMDGYGIDDSEIDGVIKANAGKWRLNQGSYLDIEAKIAREIWRAWREDLRASDSLGNAQAYNEALERHAPLQEGRRYWLLAPDEPLPVEQGFLRRCLERGDCRLVVCDRRHSPAHPRFEACAEGGARARHRWLRRCLFSHSAEAEAGADAGDGDVEGAVEAPEFSLLRCANDARQIEAIVEVVRRARGEDRRVGIVVHNRRFARALRGAMDNAGLLLSDPIGWALSTTASGSVFKAWLDVVDSDYACGDTLDFLRSAYPVFEPRQDSFLGLYERLCQDTANLFLSHFSADGIAEAGLDLEAGYQQWLKSINAAGLVLGKHKSGRASLSRWCGLIEESLRRIGLWNFLLSDEDGQGAGSLITERIQRFANSPVLGQIEISWEDLLDFLYHQLEHLHYSPRARGGEIDAELLKLGNTLPAYDLLVFAAMEQNSFPGRLHSDLLFNDDIYLQLGLPAPQLDKERLEKARFGEALLSCPRIVFAYNHADKESQPSPWLAQLIASCGDDGLNDESLLSSLDEAWRDSIQGPSPARLQPVASQGALEQPRLSVSDYQTLVDCPYRYFLGRRLGARESAKRSELMRSDVYGQLLHQALLELNSWLQESKEMPLDSEGVKRAIEKGEKIVLGLFDKWTRGSFVNLARQVRMRMTVRAYVRWLAECDVKEIAKCEEKFEISVPAKNGAELSHRGRIDVILRDVRNKKGVQEGLHLIDFKSSLGGRTGKAIEDGSDVQLSSYALAPGEGAEARSVFYLGPKTGNYDEPLLVGPSPSVEDSGLERVRRLNYQRLSKLAEAFAQEHHLPAVADKRICEHCPYQAACRPRDWSRSVPDTA